MFDTRPKGKRGIGKLKLRREDKVDQASKREEIEQVR
jgi:hypothetical protein